MPHWYYSVAQGRETGIYTDCVQARKQVLYYAGAQWKKCKSVEEAEAFIVQNGFRSVSPGIKAYTDGSFKKDRSGKARAGWGVYAPGTCASADRSRCGGVHGSSLSAHVAELIAIIKAIKLFYSSHYELTIYTDSKVCIRWIGKVLEGGRLRKNCKERVWVEKLCDIIRRCHCRPVLHFVKGHSDNPGNDEANRLARKGRMKDKNVSSANELLTSLLAANDDEGSDEEDSDEEDSDEEDSDEDDD